MRLRSTPTRKKPPRAAYNAARKASRQATAALMAMGLSCGTAFGVTTLVDENFQTPIFASGTTEPGFTGAHTWAYPGNNGIKSRLSGHGDGLPVEAGNQAIHFEWNNQPAVTIVNNPAWNAGDVFKLSVDVAPQNWNGTLDRYFKPTISQGATSWTLPGSGTLINKAGSSTWQTLEYIVPTAGFTSGSNITLSLNTLGQRGMFLDDVKLTVGAAPVDNDPPNPNPPTWNLTPTMFDYTNVIMSVNPSSDPFGVEYLFTNTTNGQNSGWQDGTQWVQSGLDQNANYNFSVLARDKSPNANVNTTAATGSATTGQLDGLIFSSTFEYPAYSSGTGNPNFPGWEWTNGGSVKARIGGSDGLSGDSSNQAIQYEYTNAFGTHKSDHAWSPDEIYTIGLNATPQAWNGIQDRSVVVTLLDQTGQILWSQSVDLPKYNAAFQGNPWDLSQYFEFIVNGSDLALAQAGDTLSLRISSAGFRGMFVDNVLFTYQSTVAPVPEPATMGLITLATIGMGMRRRRNA